jgi:hypothetical protein
MKKTIVIVATILSANPAMADELIGWIGDQPVHLRVTQSSSAKNILATITGFIGKNQRVELKVMKDGSVDSRGELSPLCDDPPDDFYRRLFCPSKE